MDRILDRVGNGYKLCMHSGRSVVVGLEDGGTVWLGG